MSTERKGRRISRVEDENLDISIRTLMHEGEVEGVLGVELITIYVGKTLEMSEVGEYLETWQVLKGTGLLSFIEAGGTNKRNVRFEEGMINQTTLGDRHGLVNIGRENLAMLVTKTQG